MSAANMPPDNVPAFEKWARDFAKSTGQPPSERDSFMEGLRQGYDAAMKDIHARRPADESWQNFQDAIQEQQE